ncbi:MAG: ATP-binding protein [Actinomycetia bacterium]|nr:ATP-binding protein [Actinomycetes bacterium]
MEFLLAELDGGTALIQRRAGDVDVHIRAADPAVAEKLALEVAGRLPVPPGGSGRVPVDFWQVANGAYTTTRRIEAPAWASIADHYPGEVGAQIGELVDLRLSLDGGRIVLWHGLPGTGKTTAIRALAREWEPDCRFQVVVDPDVVFAR